MAAPLTFRLVAQDDDDAQKSLGQPVSIVLQDGTPIKAYIDRLAGGGLPTITVASNEEIDRLFAATTTNKEA